MPSLSSPSSPPQQSLDAFDNGGVAAELRLQGAEEHLREAIEELQRRQRRSSGFYLPYDHADESCVANAIGNLCQSFLLSYGICVGIGILFCAFKLDRCQSYSSLLDLKVEAENSVMGVDKGDIYAQKICNGCECGKSRRCHVQTHDMRCVFCNVYPCTLERTI